MPIVRHAVLTVLTTSQALSAALADKGILKTLFISAGTANAGPVYVGGKDSTLTTTVYGSRIEIPTSNIPDAPIMFEGPNISLSSITVIGNANDKVHILAIGV